MFAFPMETDVHQVACGARALDETDVFVFDMVDAMDRVVVVSMRGVLPAVGFDARFGGVEDDPVMLDFVFVTPRGILSELGIVCNRCAPFVLTRGMVHVHHTRFFVGYTSFTLPSFPEPEARRDCAPIPRTDVGNNVHE